MVDNSAASSLSFFFISDGYSRRFVFKEPIVWNPFCAKVLIIFQKHTSSHKGNKTEATLILGMVYMAQGDTSNARSFYQQYIDADGDDPAKGYNGLALCDISDGDYDSALQNISQGLGDATSDEMRDLLFNEIVVYEKKLDLSTALSKAQEYVQTFKDDDAAAKELTFLQSRVGNQAAAGDASEADTSNESTAEESADTGTDESSEESY